MAKFDGAFSLVGENSLIQQGRNGNPIRVTKKSPFTHPWLTGSGIDIALFQAKKENIGTDPSVKGETLDIAGA